MPVKRQKPKKLNKNFGDLNAMRKAYNADSPKGSRGAKKSLSDEHRKKISQGLKKHHSGKAKASAKKKGLGLTSHEHEKLNPVHTPKKRKNRGPGLPSHLHK